MPADAGSLNGHSLNRVRVGGAVYRAGGWSCGAPYSGVVDVASCCRSGLAANHSWGLELQVLLQVAALRAKATSEKQLTRQYAGLFTLKEAIGISIAVAIINTARSVVVLWWAARGLQLPFFRYVWCAYAQIWPA